MTCSKPRRTPGWRLKKWWVAGGRSRFKKPDGRHYRVVFFTRGGGDDVVMVHLFDDGGGHADLYTHGLRGMPMPDEREAMFVELAISRISLVALTGEEPPSTEVWI